MKTISINGRAATLHKNNILEVINGNHIDYYEIVLYVTDEPKVMIIPREEMNSPEQPTVYNYYSVYCNGTISFNTKIPYSREEGIDILITYNKAGEDEEIPILGIELVKQEEE